MAPLMAAMAAADDHLGLQGRRGLGGCQAHAGSGADDDDAFVPQSHNCLLTPASTGWMPALHLKKNSLAK
ncbi:MAG: hypothetical protein ABSA04_10005 [Desulfobaccales bacterium]|jgi:hypothetical protein